MDTSYPDGEKTTWNDSLAKACERALRTIDNNITAFGTHYPDDCTVNQFYQPRRNDLGLPAGSNTGWTSSFWPGQLWLALELTNNSMYHDAAMEHLDSFTQRLDQRIDVDHHDLGFLYTLGATLPYRQTGDAEARQVGLRAADILMERFHETAQILQAWGDLSDPAEQGRAIIDSLMNMSLLHWASEQTGDPRFKNAAVAHVQRLRDTIIRPDDTTFHTFHFDTTTGQPLYGSTAQGHDDQSCWARGQAWGIYGFALNYRLARDVSFLDASQRCAQVFLNHLPADNVAYWDLVFDDSSGQPRDSSAAAIAVCGLLELAELTTDADQSQEYQRAARTIMASLMSNYAPDVKESNALLQHAVYSIPHSNGIDEGCQWGDYFYLEALTRFLHPQWKAPWHL